MTYDLLIILSGKIIDFKNIIICKVTIVKRSLTQNSTNTNTFNWVRIFVFLLLNPPRKPDKIAVMFVPKR